MSVTILAQPDAIAFSRNPVLFSFQSDARVLQKGAKYTATLAPIAFVGPFSFTIKYSGITLPFTAVDQPDSSGYQLTAPVAGTPAADVISRLAKELSANFYLSRDFLIQAMPAPYFSVKLTARKTGDAYSIALSDVVNLSVAKLQDGVTESYQPNFKLYMEVWGENADHTDFTKLSEAFLETTDEGQADLDLQDTLTTLLLADGYDRPNVRFASAQQDLRSCRKYYLLYAEAYGDTQVIRKLEKTDVKTALLGGISKEKLEEFAFPGYFTGGSLLKFLKQDELQQLVRPEQQEYLSLVTFNQGFSRLQLNFKIYFSDQTTVSRKGDLFSDVLQYEKYTFPVGFEQNHFQLLTTDAKYILKYEAWIAGETGAAISETRTYVLDYNYKPFTRYFLYLSSFGSYDTKLTYGKSSNQYEIVVSSASRTLQGQFHLVDGEEVNYDVNLNNTETYTTGYRSMRQIRSLRDLFLSLDKLELRKGRAYPLEFASKTISEHKDGENLHALSFEMGFRTREKLWTYDDLDDVPVGLYLNLPAGAGNIPPTMPQIPANYFDGRYYLKTETYNQAEINAKIAAILAVVNMNANASSQQFITFQQLINQQNTVINNLGVTYATRQELYTLITQLSTMGGSGSGTNDNGYNYQLVLIDNVQDFFYELTPERVAKFGNDPGFLTFNLIVDHLPKIAAETYQANGVQFSFGKPVSGLLYVTGPAALSQIKEKVTLLPAAKNYTYTLTPERVTKFGTDPGYLKFNFILEGKPVPFPYAEYSANSVYFEFGPAAIQPEIYITGPSMGTGASLLSRPAVTQIKYGDRRWNAAHTEFLEPTWAGYEPAIMVSGLRALTNEDEGLTNLSAGGFRVDAGVIQDGLILIAIF